MCVSYLSIKTMVMKTLRNCGGGRNADDIDIGLKKAEY